MLNRDISTRLGYPDLDFFFFLFFEDLVQDSFEPVVDLFEVSLTFHFQTNLSHLKSFFNETENSDTVFVNRFMLERVYCSCQSTFFP